MNNRAHVLPASSQWRQPLPSRGYKPITTDTQQQQFIKVRSLDNAQQGLSSVTSMAISDYNDTIVRSESTPNSQQLQFLCSSSVNNKQQKQEIQVLSTCDAPGPVNHLDLCGNVLMMASDQGAVYMNRVDMSLIMGSKVSSKPLVNAECTVYHLPSLNTDQYVAPSPEQYTQSNRMTRVYIQPVPYDARSKMVNTGPTLSSLMNKKKMGKKKKRGDSSDSDNDSDDGSDNSDNDDSSESSESSDEDDSKVTAAQRIRRRIAKRKAKKDKKKKKKKSSEKSSKSSNDALNSIASDVAQPTKFLALENHRLHIWQIDRESEPLNTVKGSNAPLTCAAWNMHNTNQLIIGGVSRSLKVLDIRSMVNKTGKSVTGNLLSWKCDNAHSDAIRDVQWHPMIPHWLATCGNDNVINIWDMRYNNGTPVIALEGHDNIVKSISWSNFHCDILLSGAVDHSVKLWNLRVEPHHIIATINNTFTDSVCNVLCSKTKAMSFYCQSNSGEFATIETTSTFMSPLVTSRFNENETEERDIEQIVYYRQLRSAFEKILELAKKHRADNNLEKALRLLEFCKERHLPQMKAYHNAFFNSTESIARFKKELRDYSYYLPPKVRGMDEIPLDMIKEIDHLTLNYQILRFVQRKEFSHVLALEEKMLQILGQDITCIEVSTLQDVIDLYVCNDYRKGMTLVVLIGKVFSQANSWTMFEPIAKKTLSPTIFEVSNNPSLRENAYRVLQKNLSNADFILSQVELQREVIASLWSDNSARAIIELVDHYAINKLHVDIISVPVLRTYLNALICMGQLDRLLIDGTELVQNLQGHDFSLLVKGLIRDVASVKLKNLLLKQFGVGAAQLNTQSAHQRALMQASAIRLARTTKKPAKKKQPVKKTPAKKRPVRKRRGSTSSSNSSSDSDSDDSDSDTQSSSVEDTETNSDESESERSSSESEPESETKDENDAQNYACRGFLDASGKISESVATRFFTECKSGIAIVLTISKFCQTIPTYLQQPLKEALEVVDKCIQKFCKSYDKTNAVAMRFASDILQRTNTLKTTSPDVDVTGEQLAQSAYTVKAIRIEDKLMDFLE